MAKRAQNARSHTVLTKDALAAHHKSMPKSRHGHSFAPDRIRQDFTPSWMRIKTSLGGICQLRRACRRSA